MQAVRQEGLPEPRFVLGTHWCTRAQEYLHGLPAMAFPISGPGTRPLHVIDSPLAEQNGAAVPRGSPLSHASRSLSEWKIFRGYYFPKGWPPPIPSPLVAP